MSKAKIKSTLRKSTSNPAAVDQLKSLIVVQLYDAAWFGKEDQVDEIISQEGITINVTDQSRLSDHFGWTALHYAVRRDKINPIKLLLKKNADINLKERNGATPLHFAAEKGHLRVVQYLVAYGSDLKAVDNLNNTPKDVSKNNEIKEFLTKLEILKEDGHEFDVMVMCNQDKKVEELLKIRFGKHKIGEYVAYNQEV